LLHPGQVPSFPLLYLRASSLNVPFLQARPSSATASLIGHYSNIWALKNFFHLFKRQAVLSPSLSRTSFSFLLPLAESVYRRFFGEPECGLFSFASESRGHLFRDLFPFLACIIRRTLLPLAPEGLCISLMAFCPLPSPLISFARYLIGPHLPFRTRAQRFFRGRVIFLDRAYQHPLWRFFIFPKASLITVLPNGFSHFKGTFFFLKERSSSGGPNTSDSPSEMTSITIRPMAFTVG